MAYYNAKDIEWLAEILKDDHHANIEFRSKQEINATISTDVLRSSFSTDRLSIRRTDCSLFLESSSRYQSFAIEVTINMLGINAEFKDGEITIPIASGKLKIGIRR